MLNSNNSTENYGCRWARISFRGDLYSQESTFPLVIVMFLVGIGAVVSIIWKFNILCSDMHYAAYQIATNPTSLNDL